MTETSHSDDPDGGARLAARVRAVFGASLPPGAEPVEHAMALLAEAEAGQRLPVAAQAPVEQAVEALFAISAHAFDVELPSDGTGEGLDGLAVAINVLAKELGRTAVSSAQMVSLIESLPSPVLVVTIEREVRYANPAAQAMLGTDLVGRPIHQALRADADMWPRVSTPVRLTALLDDAHLLFSIAPLVSHFGDVDGFVAVGTNITDQVQTQQALTRARDLAEANARARTRFLANMSHELRTPLNGVLGMAQLLLDAALPEEQAGLVQSIRGSGESLLAMVDDVLDFAELEAGRLELAGMIFDPAALVHECAEMLEPQRQPEVALEVALADDLPPRVVGDRRRLRQVLLNLIGNALKFTSRGEVRVQCAVGDFDADRIRLRFDVVDTGVGMSAEHMTHLFDPFTQADDSATRRFGGTGLGLAIVKRIVDAMDGEVGVESAPGRGSRFYFTVDFERAPDDGLDMRSAPFGSTPPEPAVASQLDLSGRTLLVVEDNKVNQTVVRSMMRKLGAEVVVAEHGADAVEAVRGRRFDLVLMDCQMPVMDGLEATRQLRLLDHGRTVPVVALTADAVAGHRERCFEAGMNAYLSKPLRVAELENTLRRLLSAER